MGGGLIRWHGSGAVASISTFYWVDDDRRRRRDLQRMHMRKAKYQDQAQAKQSADEEEWTDSLVHTVCACRRPMRMGAWRRLCAAS